MEYRINIRRARPKNTALNAFTEEEFREIIMCKLCGKNEADGNGLCVKCEGIKRDAEFEKGD